MTSQTIRLQSNSVVMTGQTTALQDLQKCVTDLTRLTGQAREAFVDELANLVSFIYPGHDRAWLYAELQAPNLVSARVLTIRDQNGTLIGFNMFRIHEQEKAGRTNATFHELTGLLPEYRGRNVIRAFSFVEGLAYRVCHPRHCISQTTTSHSARLAFKKICAVVRIILAEKVSLNGRKPQQPRTEIRDQVYQYA